jgi:hypothetical protein
VDRLARHHAALQQALGARLQPLAGA